MPRYKQCARCSRFTLDVDTGICNNPACREGSRTMPGKTGDDRIEIIQAELLRFLTSQRTKEYELEHNAYWSLGDMVKVFMRTGMHRDWGHVSVTDMVVEALVDLSQQRKVQLNPKYAPSTNVAKFIRELQTETEPLFRAL